jgi:hypothetical protein
MATPVVEHQPQGCPAMPEQAVIPEQFVVIVVYYSRRQSPGWNTLRVRILETGASGHPHIQPVSQKQGVGPINWWLLAVVGAIVADLHAGYGYA